MKINIFFAFILSILFGCAERNVSTGFESVKFHTTMCFGTCPVYHMEVDKDKNIKLFAEKVFSAGSGRNFGTGDSTKMGYFTGVVSDTTFAKLLKEVAIIVKDTTAWEKADCCDGSTKTIIINYDGKRKYLRSMFPPENANKIIAVLYEIAQESKLARTDKKFEVEQ